MYAFDSAEELEKLARHAPGSRVYCRILVENEGADWPLSRKFGTTLETARELMLRAGEMDCDAVLKATNVDGVYSADPNKDPPAKRFDKISHKDALDRDLKVMDATAFALARENRTPIIVFSIRESRAVETVLREPMMVALPAGHPIARHKEVRIPDLSDQPLILYPRLPIAGLAQQVMQAFNREKSILRVEQEVEDVLTAIALVAGGFGVCVTTASTASLRLPGVVYRPLVSNHLREIELSCLYRQSDESPVLAAFLSAVRNFKKPPVSHKTRPAEKRRS